MNQLPFLDLDAATQLYLPHAPARARAQHRLVYRAPDGEEVPLLARLCAFIHPEVEAEDRAFHCVVLRPENAQADRISVVGNFDHRLGTREICNWMTPQQARRFDWALFAIAFNDAVLEPDLGRMWSVAYRDHRLLLQVDFGGNGRIVGRVSARGSLAGSYYAQGNFCWTCDGFTGEGDNASRVTRWLQTSGAEFDGWVRALWNDPGHEVHFALSWEDKTDAERAAIAFECGNGSWEQLREIAAVVLRGRLGQLQNEIEASCTWDFAAYSSIVVLGIESLHNDGALFLWRTALTHFFRTPNFGGEGVRIDSLPLCLWTYASHHQMGAIEVSAPTMHEIMEANLQLQAWTRAHFSAANARILMNSLAKFSEAEARHLCASLDEVEARQQH